VELILITSKQEPTTVVTTKSKDSVGPIKFDLLAPDSDSESVLSTGEANFEDTLKENEALKRTVLASKEYADAEAARPEIDTVIRETTKRTEKKKRRKLADKIDEGEDQFRAQAKMWSRMTDTKEPMKI
jgi:hypothetical protein